MTTALNFDMILPASLEAERAILGSILLDNRAYAEAAQSLTEDDFSLDSHRRLFRLMSELAGASTPIDLVTIVSELDRRRELATVGDAWYVSSLLDGVPDRPSIAHYLRIAKEKAFLRRLIRASEAAIVRASDGEKSTDVASALLEAILEVEAQSQQSHALTAREFMPQVLQELQMEAQSGVLVGLPTGLDPLDVVTGGLRPGELVVIGTKAPAAAAHASSGSSLVPTAVASQIVVANAAAGHPVGVFSLEMSRWDLAKRLLASVTPVSASKIRHPSHITKDDWLALAQGAAEICDWPVWFDDAGTISVPQLLARARLLISRMKVKMVVVDYLQLVQVDAANIRERVGKVADALRQLAKAERVSVVLLSQLRRPQNVNDLPTMLELKESGDIEAHAHLVLLLHAPIGQDGRPTGEDTIIIGKNRNGAKGPVPVMFSPHKLRFYPRSCRELRVTESGD